ncbi:substrate-binding periplasmic protein [Silvanigrella aquatica]|uniref:Solute-binding protein family 3/N-terminal domain-containing protein n=1 Tax=Silvanigrella aquatica TaxID=1915309 RepID=A0A1L4D125_9BACT|nr:transporter substrate-binding domain-containing protein [Silvanigrella aquatica]APJ03896.1 hypothetical protein AXG55_08255 [Silvanigrella aquatica]
MKSTFHNFLKNVFLSATMLLPITNALSEEQKVIQFGSDFWCPYTCDETTSQKKGYVVDMAEEIFAKHNIKFKYVVLPWARVLKANEKGELDAMGAAYKEGREDKYIFPKEDFGKSLNKFYVLKDNKWNYKDPESLKNITVGLTLGYVYGGEINTINKYAKQVVPAGGESVFEKNINKVLNKQIDATIEESIVANYTLKQIKLNDKVREAGSIGKKTGIYIGFPKVLPNSEKYAKMLSDGIIELKKTGRFKQILKKYDIKIEN